MLPTERTIAILLPLLALSGLTNIASAQVIASSSPESLVVVTITSAAPAALNKPERAPLAAASAPGHNSAQEAGTGDIPHGKTHVVVKDDTLWSLADLYYTDPFKWVRIYKANLDTIKNPDLIYPGDELNIPLRLQPATAKPAQAQTATAAAEPAAAVAAPKAEPAPVIKPSRAKNEKPAAYSRITISEEMPEDQTAWPDNTIIVQGSWRRDGKVTATQGTDSGPRTITEPGDVVMLSITSNISVTPGDTFKTYMQGPAAFNKNGKKLGKELTQTGTVRVISVDGKKVKARIISATTTVSKGQLIKK